MVAVTVHGGNGSGGGVGVKVVLWWLVVITGWCWWQW